MAEFINGANGSFSGKVGSVVGSNWREIKYIRGVGKKSTKPSSQSQLEQQAKFGLITRFLSQIKDLLNLGFSNGKIGRATGYNLAVQTNLKSAIIGSFPEFEIDYQKVQISKGSLLAPAAATLAADTPGIVSASWDQTPNEFNGWASDKVSILLFNSDKGAFISNSQVPAIRSDGSIEIPVPDSYSGDKLQGYIYMTSTEKGRMSNSLYMGTVTLP